MAMNRLNRLQHEAIAKVQWAGNKCDGKGPFCPYCGGYSSDGHKDGCAIDQALDAFQQVIRAQGLVD